MPHLRICDPLPQFPLSPDEKCETWSDLRGCERSHLVVHATCHTNPPQNWGRIPSPLLRNSIKYLGGILIGFSHSGCVISSPLVVAGLLRRMHLVVLRLWPLIKAVEIALRVDFDAMTILITRAEGLAAIFFSSHTPQFQMLLQTALTLPCHNRV